MEVVSHRTGISLEHSLDSASAAPGFWYHTHAAGPSAPPGQVRLRLHSMEQVFRLARELHGKAVNLGSDLVAIELVNDEVDRVQGNGQAGRRGGGPRPAARAPGL